MSVTEHVDVTALIARVEAALPAHGRRLGVAFSGGVDSAALLALAVDLRGADQVVALLGVSPSLARRERALAHRVATQIGATVVEVETHEGEDPDYQRNDVDRCFHCKDALFTQISRTQANRLGLDDLAYGENADDTARPDRPGSRAATEHGVLRPLATAGLTKAEVRAVARHYGLSVADKPATPCLASRIPHGQAVTPEKLDQIDRAEEVLARLGFSDFRVRHHGDIARVEVLPEELVKAVSEPQRTMLVDEIRAAGFRHVTIDLAGIQSGAFTLPLLQIGAQQ